MANWDPNSIVDYLKSQGQDSSYSARKKIAAELGIKNYSGTGEQNTQMLNTLKNGASTGSTSKGSTTPKTTTPTTPTTTTPAPTTTTVTPPKGVDASLTETMTTPFTPSTSVTEKDKAKEDAMGKVESVTSVEQIISPTTMATINKGYTKPTAVIQADSLLNQQLSQIQSGKTSYSDQVRDMISKIQNRDAFEYDVDSDPLFQQALASAMGSGKQAMQDTIGQASALTGGYGSTYATSAGNQAYNAFIEDAYNNLPEYYQMAMEAYQMEGQELYNQLAMLSEEDAKEYSRLLDSYNATYAHRNQMYNESYNEFRDEKSDAFASANLQLSEHNQLVNDAYTWYNTVSDDANTTYDREYTAWADSIAQATTLADMQSKDYWANVDDEYRKDRDKIDDSRYIAENDWNGDGKVDVNDEKARTRFGQGDVNNDGVIDETESVDGGGTEYKLTDTEITTIREKHDEGGVDAVMDYLAQKGKLPQTQEEADIVASVYGGTTAGTNPKTTTPAKGIVLNFKTSKGDNFDVSVNGEKYRVENQGEETNKNLINEFNKLDVKDGEAFLYSADNRVYVKKGGKYYKTGATEILGFNTRGHSNLKSALYNLTNGGK